MEFLKIEEKKEEEKEKEKKAKNVLEKNENEKIPEELDLSRCDIIHILKVWEMKEFSIWRRKIVNK